MVKLGGLDLDLQVQQVQLAPLEQQVRLEQLDGQALDLQVQRV